MEETSKIPEFPNYPTGALPIIYCSTDREASKHGCSWGLVIAHIGNSFWVLTSIGIRYYGIESEHEFITHEDSRWIVIHSIWNDALKMVRDRQSKVNW
jgi:hypothetical protein